MTNEEAFRIVSVVMGAFPRTEWPADTLQVFKINLLPLPFDYCWDRVRKGVMAAQFPPHLSELRAWCGIDSEAARSALLKAIDAGGTLERDWRSPGDWRPILPGAPPQDVPQLTAGPTVGKGIRLLLKEQREQIERTRKEQMLEREDAVKAAALEETARLAGWEPMPTLPGQKPAGETA